MKKNPILPALVLMALLPAIAQRPLKPSDVYRLKTLSEPAISPEGNWVAYSISTVDSVKDKRSSDLWMSSWDGKEHLQLTHTPDGEGSPAFSPDGTYISFLSSRGKLDHAQVWLMDRRGGEARKLTGIAGTISGYEWSPDGKKILLVVRDLERADSLKEKPRDPMVIDRVHFKQDYEGYKLPLYRHLYLFDLSTSKLDTLTTGAYDNHSPAFSPDGQRIVFVSNRTADPDRNGNTDLWIIDAKPRSAVRKLTDWMGSDSQPRWSPDGTSIAYLRSTGTGNFLMYEQSVLCTIDPNGGQPMLHTAGLDRDAYGHRWSKDGKTIAFLISDDRHEYAATVAAGGGPVNTLDRGHYEYSLLSAHPTGNWLAMVNHPDRPDELYALEGGHLRRITSVHDDFVKGILFSTMTGFTSKSKDGANVSNILLLPPGMREGKKLPVIFFIHGGPVAQDTYGFDLSRQILAAAGYAVCAVNYRGSNGRGLAFTKAIYGDWGNKEVLDIFGAADELVRNGTADPSRLGIGGWSYGGILTNYSIASDPSRFRAAASGAGSSLQLSLFGVDQYINQFENELGYPWKNLDKYLKVSYPFLKADKIKTPTLFMTGEKDFNVPAVGSEQMYQALRVLGVPTRLIVYPDQFHGIGVPSYQADRFNRYLDWFTTHMKDPGPVKVNQQR